MRVVLVEMADGEHGRRRFKLWASRDSGKHIHSDNIGTYIFLVWHDALEVEVI